MAWPEIGGGGGMELGLNEEELFDRLCAWDAEDYIIGCVSSCCTFTCYYYMYYI